MDNDYRCSLDVWGSAGTITASRILTAPAGMSPPAIIRANGVETKLELPSDDTFLKSVKHFLKCVNEAGERERNYEEILAQAILHLSIK
jgi:hypothetical protein